VDAICGSCGDSLPPEQLRVSGRRQIAVPCLSSLPIVEHLDVLADPTLGGGACLVPAMMH
jgi:hypothetical protein